MIFCLVGGTRGQSFQSVSYRLWTPFASRTMSSSSLRNRASRTACLCCSCRRPQLACSPAPLALPPSCRVPACLCCTRSCTSLLLAAKHRCPRCQQPTLATHASACFLSDVVVEIGSMFASCKLRHGRGAWICWGRARRFCRAGAWACRRQPPVWRWRALAMEVQLAAGGTRRKQRAAQEEA